MKNNRKKIVALFLGTALAASSFSVSALSFSDVEGVETVAWAEPAIDRMTEEGYIKGYEDGTFKPSQSITKVESLVMMSRMLGLEEEEWEYSLAAAETVYGPQLSAFKTPYKSEIAFLMYWGVLDESDLTAYVSETNAAVPLKRYEAAILLTKMMGAEEDVENQLIVSSSYSDSMEIPSDARAYVEYVREQGIMQGMGNDASGKPYFSPNTEVTRAQMAQILANLIDVLDRKTVEGTIASLDSFNDRITVTVNDLDMNYDLAENMVIRKEGEAAELGDLETGKNARVTHMNGLPRLVEEITGPQEETDTGTIVSAKSDSNGRTITIRSDATGRQVSYTVDEDCEVRIKSTLGDFSNLKANDYAQLTLENNKVTKIETLAESQETSGLVNRVEADEETVTLYLEDLDGNVTSYDISDSVNVTRNGSEVGIRELAKGDKVTLRLNRGAVTKITASSSNSAGNGVIEEIILSSEPKITIRVDGESETYNVHQDATITIDDQDATLYDLRPNTSVRFTLESDELKSIRATSVTSKTQVSGTVKAINTKYDMITVTQEDGTDESVFVNSSTRYINSEGKSNFDTIDSLKRGQSVLITGSNSTGVFEASIVIMQD